MKTVVQFLSLSLLVTFSPVALGQPCPNISGNYLGEETYTITTSVAGDVDVDSGTGGGSVTITQNNCAISYPALDIQRSNLTIIRTGVINANQIQIKGPFVVFQNLPGLVVTRNEYTATGIVEAGRITIKGTGTATATLQGQPIIVTGESTVILTGAVTPLSPPTIIVSPTNQIVTVGGTASFNVGAVGTLPLAYQWDWNGTNLLGQTNATLTLTNVIRELAGNYRVTVSNAFGSATSSAAMLTVKLATDSSPMVVYSNGSGSPIMGYGSSLEIGDQITLIAPTIPKTLTAFEFEYVAEVAAGAGRNVRLRLYENDGPVVEQTNRAPSTLLYDSGEFPTQSGSNTVQITGLAIPLRSSTLTWAVQFSSPNGKGLPSLLVYDLPTVGSSTEFYWKNVFGEWRIERFGGSAPANFGARVTAIVDGLAIVKQPESAVVEEGKALTFSVTATGIAPLIYQWQKEGVGILGATNSILSLAAASLIDAGNYSVLVRDSTGAILSDQVILKIQPALKLVVRLAAPQFLPKAGFQMQIIGSNVSRIVIQSSNDLIEWTTVTTNVPSPSGEVKFAEPTSLGFDRHFYRAIGVR